MTKGCIQLRLTTRTALCGHLPVLFSHEDWVNKPIQQSLNKPVRSLPIVRRNHCCLLLNKSCQTSVQDYPMHLTAPAIPVSNAAGNNCATKVFSVTHCQLLTTTFFSPSLTPVTPSPTSHSQELFGTVAW